MQIYIPSYNRAETHSTYYVLKDMGIPSKVVVHTEKDKAEYLKFGMTEEDCLCLNAGKGLAANRNAILKYVKENDEEDWHVQMSDDAIEFTKVHDDYYYKGEVHFPRENPKSMEKYFKIPITTADDLNGVFYEAIDRAREIGAFLIGFAVQDNYFFRSKKWKKTGLVDGRCWILHKNNPSFDPNCDCRDDVSQTAENLYRHGKILINNFMLPDFKRYSSGGLGTPKERYEKRKEECAYLMKKYPTLFKLKHEPEKFRIDVSFKRNSPKAFENWRAKMTLFNRNK